MAHAHTHEGERRKVTVCTVTVSDTRTEADDEGGRVLREELATAGFVLGSHVIVRDEPGAVRGAIEHAVGTEGADAVVTTGGTGIAPRDTTYEAVSAMLEKQLDGFGEAFRRLSWEQVGARSILSRAVAGTYRDAFVAALPGSPNAVRLAVQALLGPVLPHAIALLKK